MSTDAVFTLAMVVLAGIYGVYWLEARRCKAPETIRDEPRE